MKFELPEIAWHGTQPIYSCDFQLVSNDRDLRLATAGADNEVKLWRLWCYDHQLKLEVLSVLSEHKRSVNCVKFCPVLIQNQPLLASSDDDGVVCLWTRCDEKEKYAASFLDDDTDLNKEYWKVSRTLRGHIEEVQDLCWNSDGTLLLSGSIDTSARLWHVATGQCLHAFRESKGLVQGVSIDPLGKFIATFADDKSVRIYHATNKRCAYRNSKFVHNDRSIKLFGDTGDGFFHRICFSPHGEFFVVPSGSFQVSAESSVFCTYVYSRDNLSKPSLYLPCGKRPSVAVAFCPIKFKYRREESPTSRIFNVSYRLVFTVITENTLLFYDTETFDVFSKVENIHYASLNSGSWSKDGLMFVATSSDGYATICTFESGELGEKLEESQIAFQTVQTPQNTPVLEGKPRLCQDQMEVEADDTANKKQNDEVSTPQKGTKSNVESACNTPVCKEKPLSEESKETPTNPQKGTQEKDAEVTPKAEKSGLNRTNSDKLNPTSVKTILKPASPTEDKSSKLPVAAASPKSVSFSPHAKTNAIPSVCKAGKVDSHSKKKAIQKPKIAAAGNQIVNAFARGSRILAESLKNQKPEDVCLPSDPDNPIYIDDDSIAEVAPLNDKTSEANLMSPKSNVSSAPPTPKSILKTPSPDSPATGEMKKRRVSFRTLDLDKASKDKPESDQKPVKDCQPLKEESKNAVEKKVSQESPNVGKKRKVPFITIA